ncbi:type IX secretion system membrane protein PorP/SprF, partial [Tenacibaculum maritimum]
MRLTQIQSNMNILLQRNILLLGIFLLSFTIYGQQDPQYTQYMYNTMSVNPAYSGSRGHTTITGLARTQWVGFTGAPQTQTLSYDTPLGYSGVGLGVNLVNDKIGPVNETSLDVNTSYTLRTSDEGNFAFGLKLGARLFNIDWSKGRYRDATDKLLNENINNKFLPTVGAGLYYYTPKWYAGISVPNFLRTDHYDNDLESVAAERMHYFLIAGYVFDLNDRIKFKPAVLTKVVSGAPLSLDVSANFLFHDRFNAGISWRWDDSISGILGFQVTEGLHIGYAYDLTTSNLQNYNSGTHEIMLRYEIFKEV